MSYFVSQVNSKIRPDLVSNSENVGFTRFNMIKKVAEVKNQLLSSEI